MGGYGLPVGRSCHGGYFVRTSRRRLSILGAAALLVAVVAAPGDAAGPLDPVLGDPGTTYPDLKPDVQNAHVNTFQFGGVPYLLFDTWSMNIGPAALQITASGLEEEGVDPTVSQCVSWYEDHVCREQVPVGGFLFHLEHTHFHFEDFATYTLRHLLPDGTPDYSAAGVISVSEKVSFCLIDIEKIDDNAFPAPYYTLANCYAPVQMGISSGWADNYDSSIPGQELSLAGVSDGRYAVVVDQDPENRLYEVDNTNNRVVFTFTVTGLGVSRFPQISNVQRSWPATGDDGGTTTTSSTTTTSTTSTSTTSTSTTTTVPCQGGGGGGGGKGGGGGGGGGKKKC